MITSLSSTYLLFSSTTDTTTTPSAVDAAATHRSAAAASASADPSPGLEEALMAFARTLTQAMRAESGGRGERARGDDGDRDHRHHHHGHGRWGDPAQRVEALARQIGVPAGTTAAPAAKDAASSCAGLHQRLLDAFADLQQAMGKSDAGGGAALTSELADFLHALADRLRGVDTATAEAATQPGALVCIAA